MSTQTDIGLSPELVRNSRFLLSLPVRECTGWGVPAFPECKAAYHSHPRRLCHRSTHQLPPPGLRSATSAARASRFARPPASLSSTRSLPPECRGPERRCSRERGRRPSWGAGQSGQAAVRGRRRAPPLLSGPCQCFALGAVVWLGSFPGALRPGRPPPQTLSAGSVGPPRFPDPAQAASGAGARWGPGQGEGSQGPLVRHWLIFYSVDMFSYC